MGSWCIISLSLSSRHRNALPISLGNRQSSYRETLLRCLEFRLNLGEFGPNWQAEQIRDHRAVQGGQRA